MAPADFCSGSARTTFQLQPACAEVLGILISVTLSRFVRQPVIRRFVDLHTGGQPAHRDCVHAPAASATVSRLDTGHGGFSEPVSGVLAGSSSSTRVSTNLLIRALAVHFLLRSLRKERYVLGAPDKTSATRPRIRIFSVRRVDGGWTLRRGLR